MRRIFRHHPVYGYQFIPNLQARIPRPDGAYLIKVNGGGFRGNREYVAPSRDGLFRVALFGDSFTAADGVRNEERYSDVLETLVPGVEVYNYGLPGSGTDQQYLVFREEVAAAHVEYDLLVIAVLVENIRRIVAHWRPYEDEDGRTVYYAKPYFTRDEGVLQLHHQPVPAEPVPAEALDAGEGVYSGGRFPVLRQISRTFHMHDVLQRLTGYQPVPDYDDPSSEAWLLMRAILDQWIGDSAAPVVLFPIPLYQHVEDTASADGYRARFAELAAPPRVQVHDPLPYFWKTPAASRRQFRFATDVHPTPAAHRVLAEALADVVRPRVHAMTSV